MGQIEDRKAKEIIYFNYQAQRIRCAVETGLLTQSNIHNLSTGKMTLCTVVHTFWPYSGVEFYANPSDPTNPDKAREVQVNMALLRRPVCQLEVDLGEIDLSRIVPAEEEKEIPHRYAYRRKDISKGFIEPL